MERKSIRAKYKQEKAEARKQYKAQKRAMKTEYNSQMNVYYSSEEFTKKANPPRRSILEEIGNAVTHGVGAIFAVIAYVLMMVAADTPVEYVAACIYFFGLFVMFVMSCLYHSFRYGRTVKRVFRRFDYSSIYLLIGATFAPILLCYIGGTYGIVFCIVQWAIIATGITFVGIYGPTRLRWLHIPLYCILGWSALLFVPHMISHNINLFWWILSGGITYSLGIIPFAIPKKVSHFLWHFFVLAGAVIQWVGIYLYIYVV